MVDQARRRQYAQLLRHFAAGRLTNFAYEDRADDIMGTYRSDEGRADPALWAIYQQVWFMYDDLHTHRLAGRYALSRKTRREVARWILFLYTDDEYLWPEDSIQYGLGGCLLNIVTLGLWGWITRPRELQRLQTIGEVDAWPFLNHTGVRSACRTVRLFGRRATHP